MNAMYQIKYVQAKSLLEQGKTYKQISASTGLSEPTIAKISTGRTEISPSWLKSVKSIESQKLTYLIHTILDAITPEKLAASSSTQLVTSAAILVDKRRLLDGESTVNILHSDLMTTLSDDRAQLMRQLDALK